MVDDAGVYERSGVRDATSVRSKPPLLSHSYHLFQQPMVFDVRNLIQETSEPERNELTASEPRRSHTASGHPRAGSGIRRC